MTSIDPVRLESVVGGESAAYNKGYAGAARFITKHMAHWNWGPWQNPTGGPNNERFLNVPYIGPIVQGLGQALNSQQTLKDRGRGITDATRETKPWNK